MMSALQTQSTYVPVADIAMEGPFRFRFPAPEKARLLIQSLKKLGQTHPITLERTTIGTLQIIDGHLRFDAVMEIRSKGGSWEKMLAHIIPEGQLTVVDRFRLLQDRNMNSDSPLGLVEKGIMLKKFLSEGMPLQTMAEEWGLAPHAAEDLIEVSAARPALANLINTARIEPVYALMLHQRFESWFMASPIKAEAVAIKVLQHARNEKLTVKSWRFLLDFYWCDNRPFLDGRYKSI